MEPDGPPNVSQVDGESQLDIERAFPALGVPRRNDGQAVRRADSDGLRHIKETFNTVWVIDMQTSIMTCEGKGENGNKVITLEGTSSCPGTGRKDVPIKTTYRVVSPDSYDFEMFNDGTKSMEIKYTRK